MKTRLDSMNGDIGWPKKESFIIGYAPKRLEIVEDDPVFDPSEELMLSFRTVEGNSYSWPQRKRGGERNLEVAVQMSLLEKMANVAFWDGDMINLEKIFAQPLKRSDIEFWSELFLGQLEGKDIRGVLSVPTRGIIPAYEVCRRLPGAVYFFSPSKEDSIPKVHQHTDVIVGKTFSHRAGALKEMYLDREGFSLVRGKNVAFIDDILFTGGAVITCYGMCKEAIVNLVFIGAYIDKGYGALEKIKEATGIEPYCIIEIDKHDIKQEDGKTLVHFNRPCVYMWMSRFSE